MCGTTSLNLYLAGSAGRVVETDALEDVGAGVYPCYWRRHGGRLRVATSAAALIADAGSLEPDHDFRPPDFLAEHFSPVGLGGGPPAKPKRRDAFYVTSRTIDRRVSKLRPFETVTAGTASIAFEPDGTLRDLAEIAERSARHVGQCIRDAEARFPGHQHVILTGGKDSQLLWLVPKADPSRWHVFSAEPNRPIVAAWMERNGVRPARVFGHDNHNDESADDLERKIVAGDLMSDPTHIRWMPALACIRAELGGACLFWGGTMSGPAHVFGGAHRRLDGTDREAFFGSHFTRTASWQGNYHQVFLNLVGSPYLSPYHTREIWDDVFRHLDPGVVTRETDLRDRIGERLLERPVWWPTESPGPAPWIPSAYVDARAVYLRHLRALLAAKR